MGLFGRDRKPEVTETFKVAERVLQQTEALCACVLEYVDGTTEDERKIIEVVREKQGNAQRLDESLHAGEIDPQMCISMGFALTFGQMVELVRRLDASTPEEGEMVRIAKEQLALALQAGYPPAVELNEKGQLPL